MQGERSSGKIVRKNPATIFLPDDVIEEILSRLPAKSLLRFRSVHKQWLSLISHQNFVKSNLKHVLSHNQKLILSLPCEGKPRFCQIYSIDYESKGSSINAVKFHLPVKELTPYEYMGPCLIGSCNGLLCSGILVRKETWAVLFVISNPLLKIHKIVTECDYPWNSNTLIGFGYDSVGDDYKLVRVETHSQLVNVYSLKTNLSRSFTLQPPDIYFGCVDHPRRRGMYFNGSLYWLSDRQSPQPTILIWFDLQDEKFGKVEVPLEHNRSVCWSELGFGRGCLCIFTMDSNNLYLKLLMMKVDKSNVISWSVGANLEHPNGLREWSMFTKPICITTDGGILMGIKNKSEENYEFIINNPHKGTVKDIPVHGLRTFYFGMPYFETLVSPIECMVVLDK